MASRRAVLPLVKYSLLESVETSDMGERDYRPSKSTVISFGLALKLPDSEMDALLLAKNEPLVR
jgi:hypothetical protein